MLIKDMATKGMTAPEAIEAIKCSDEDAIGMYRDYVWENKEY